MFAQAPTPSVDSQGSSSFPRCQKALQGAPEFAGERRAGKALVPGLPRLSRVGATVSRISCLTLYRSTSLLC